VAPSVLNHVISLYKQALKKVSTGEWLEEIPKVEDNPLKIERFETIDGLKVQIPYMKKREFDLGQMCISETQIVFEVENQYKDLFDSAHYRMKSFKFMNEKMANEMMRYLPQPESVFKTKKSHVMILRKTPDQVLLADLIEYLGGRVVPIPHIGWILNSLYNVACYLQWSGLVHNGISPETVFVSPTKHSCMILGGWWFSKREGDKLTALPTDLIKFIPSDVIRTKTAKSKTDLELIKATGRAVLGDAVGAHLKLDKKLPEGIIKWLELPSSGEAVKDYGTWKREVILPVFGPPKFVPMKIDTQVLYGD
jgi:hypothetical protein